MVKIMGKGGENYKQYRDEDITSKLNIAGFYPLDIMVTGVTGAGKSTTLNAIFEKDVADEGNGVDPQTMTVDSYYLSDRRLRLWDTPGLGDGIKADAIHSKKIIDLLHKSYGESVRYGFIDLVLVILEGGSRDLGTTYKLLNEVIIPNVQADRILIAINQCDMGLKGKGWIPAANKPSEELLKQLDEKVISIQERVYNETAVWIEEPIYFSALYNFNIYQLLDLIIDNIPKERRRFLQKSFWGFKNM
ncbi:TPA: GTPase family protein [Bacillus paranthracis]